MLRLGLCVLGLVVAAGPSRADVRPFRIVGLAAGADCRTVQEAIDTVPADNTAEKVILLQPGAFFGHTVLNKPHVTLRGSGPATLLTYNLGQAMPGADGTPIGWQGASALLITAEAHDAVVENLTLENTYGKGMQAQACSVIADRVTFRRCRILGWQDTLRLEAGRQYFSECYISGHVDFIYGAATAYFEGSEIFCRDQGYITAPATPADQPGFVFFRCRVTFPYGNPQVYLGRPWHESPAATFIQCELGAGIRAEGWKEWNVKPPLVRFAEYACSGPGAAAAGRVGWAVVSAGASPPKFNRAAVLGNWPLLSEASP
jgi:pectinesterase